VLVNRVFASSYADWLSLAVSDIAVALGDDELVEGDADLREDSTSDDHAVTLLVLTGTSVIVVTGEQSEGAESRRTRVFSRGALEAYEVAASVGAIGNPCLSAWRGTWG